MNENTCWGFKYRSDSVGITPVLINSSGHSQKRSSFFEEILCFCGIEKQGIYLLSISIKSRLVNGIKLGIMLHTPEIGLVGLHDYERTGTIIVLVSALLQIHLRLMLVFLITGLFMKLI
jgi:hypothetical protein